MRYLVTGATGFVGSHVVERLIRSGHEVVAVARDPKRADALEAMGAEVVAGDITDKESLRRPMKGVDGVFHLAAWYKIGAVDKSAATRINVDGTRNVFELMDELGIRKGVYTSSVAVFGDTRGSIVDETYMPAGGWVTHYDRTKCQAHFDVALPMMRRGLPLVIVQPGAVYGPGDTSMIRPMLVQYLRRRLFAVVKGSAFCFVHVDDVARAHMAAMEKGRLGHSYILCGPPHTVVEALEVAQGITGIPGPRLRLPPWIVKAVAAVLPFEKLKLVAGRTYLADGSKARKELGFEPRPLEVGLRDTLEHEMRLLGLERPA